MATKKTDQQNDQNEPELDTAEQQAKVDDLERQLRAAKTAPAKLQKLAQPGHKEPTAHPTDPRVRVWEPEAWNAHLTKKQQERGEERNMDCPPSLNKLHTITDKPIVKKDYGQAQVQQRRGPVPGGDAIAEPYTG